MFYTFPYLGIIFAPMIIFYYAVSLYYRRNSVEMKRLDSLLRSNLFASYSGRLPIVASTARCTMLTSNRDTHWSEHCPSLSLTGTSNDAFPAWICLKCPLQYRFIAKSEAGLDQENRAYYMTIAVQRWLAVRLDILGNLLILGIGLFAAGFRRSVDPSKIGVVMSYALSSEFYGSCRI